MSLDGGSVVTRLSGRFDGAAYAQFDAANKQAVASSEAAESRMTAAAGRVSAAHERIASSAAKVSQASARLSEDIPLKAMDGWANSSSKASQNLNRLGNDAAKVGTVGLLALAAGVIYATAKARDFNQEMLRLHTQAGASADEVARFKTQVLALAGTVPQGPKELAEGLYHIVSAGFRGAQAMEILKAAAEGAALGGASLEDTSNALVGTMVSQIKGARDAAQAQGELNAIVGVGNMRFEELDKAIGTNVLPTFAEAGLSITDFGAALATVTDNSTPANVTATRLKMTIAQMVDPSKAAAEELAKIGINSTQLATDLRQPNGLLVAVEDLKNHLRDSGKTAVEQDQILSASFGRGKSSGVIMLLVDELGRLQTKYKELESTDGTQRLAKSWAEFQQSEAAKLGELKSGAEAFAITVGDVLMPELDKLAAAGHEDLSKFISSGGAEETGHTIESVFSTVASAIGDLAPDIEAGAGALYHIAAAASSVGDTFGLGLSGQIAAAAAAFLTFRSVAFVAPILSAIGGAMATVGVAASTAPSVGAFVADLSEAGLAVPILGGAVALAAGAFVALQSGLFSSESAAERNANAMRADKEAIEGLHNATAKASESHIAAERAALAHKKALEELAAVEKNIRTGQLKGTQAANARTEAKLTVAETSNEHAAAIQQETTVLKQRTQAAEKGKQTAEAAVKLAGEELKTAEEIVALHPPGTQQEEVLQQEHLNTLRSEYNKASERQAQILAELQVKQESYNRLNTGEQSAITPSNARGVADLQDQLKQAGASTKITGRYELESQGAQAQLGELAQKLAALGHQQVVAKVLTTASSAQVGVLALQAVLRGIPSSKVISILHNAPSASAAMRALHEAINQVPSAKTVALSTNARQVQAEVSAIQSAINSLTGKMVEVAVKQTMTSSSHGMLHASGRGPGSREEAIVGEGHGPEYVIDANTGAGFKTAGPMMTTLGPSDYVIPLEDQYRGRALGLFAMLARDLGVQAHKKGKPAKHRPVPPTLDALSLPLEEIVAKVTKAKDAYDTSHTKVASLTAEVATDTRDLKYASSKGTTRANDQQKLNETKAKLTTVQAEERKHHQELQAAEKALAEAKAYQKKINDETSLANIAANEMKIADAHNDETGYQAAKHRRLTALSTLQGLIANARKHVAGGDSNPYFLKLTEELQSAQLEGEATAGEETGALTPAQQAQEKQIEERIALAALTPELGDDEAAGGELVQFLEGALASAQSRHAPPEAVIELANQLKTARSNLETLTTGTTEADVQARLTQAEERAEVAERTANIASQAMEVLGNANNIGAPSSPQVVVNQTNQMLHPGSPGVASALASAVTTGIGYQHPRPATRIQVGP